MTDVEGFLTMYGHSDNLLNNNVFYLESIEEQRSPFAVIRSSGVRKCADQLQKIKSPQSWFKFLKGTI